MKKNIILLLIVVGVLSACRKLPNPDPSFDVSLPKLTYKAGDTVHFTLTGDPDILTFYSGEVGHNYAYANRLYSPVPVTLTLGTTVTSVSTGANANCLHLLATNDTLVLDSAHVVNAHWTDITNRATLATGATTVTSNVDLTDLSATTHPLALALRYVTVNTDIQPTWNILTFNINTVDPTRPAANNTIITAASATANWFTVHTRTSPSVVSTPWSIFSTTLSIPTAAVGTPGRDDWVVTGPIYPDRVAADVPNGTSATIKSFAVTSPVTSYIYSYPAAGTYTATFVATNVVAGEAPKVLTRQFTITVVP